MSEKMETKETIETINNLPFSKILAINLDDLDYRVFTLKKASLIIIDGGLGEGKTTIAVEVADYINSLHKLPPIDLKGCQLGLGGEQFLDKLDICYEEKLPCIIYDEAGDFSKRGALTRFNAMINRMFEMFRAYKVIVIMCLPTFDVLDSSLMDKKIPRLLLNLNDRTLNQGNFRGFGFDRMGWVKYKMQKLAIKSYAYNYVDPNFYGHFKDLEPNRSLLLDKISTENKRASNTKERIKYEGLLTRKEMAHIVGKAPGTIKNLLFKLDIKPIRKLGREVYFSPDVADKLREHYDNEGLI
jgi:hypothetical protein